MSNIKANLASSKDGQEYSWVALILGTISLSFRGVGVPAVMCALLAVVYGVLAFVAARKFAVTGLAGVVLACMTLMIELKWITYVYRVLIAPLFHV